MRSNNTDCAVQEMLLWPVLSSVAFIFVPCHKALTPVKCHQVGSHISSFKYSNMS